MQRQQHAASSKPSRQRKKDHIHDGNIDIFDETSAVYVSGHIKDDVVEDIGLDWGQCAYKRSLHEYYEIDHDAYRNDLL